VSGDLECLEVPILMALLDRDIEDGWKREHLGTKILNNNVIPLDIFLYLY
jgi:hypothetical protein